MTPRNETNSTANDDAHRKAILSNIPDQAWLKDIDSRYVAVNEAYVAACGVSEDHIIGRVPTDVWPPEIAEQYLKTDRRVIASGMRQRFEEKRPDHRGRIKCYETIKTPVRDTDGKIVGTAGISRDITHRKRLERDLRKSRGRLRELSSHLYSIREEERARIARELHDELGQNLTALRLGLDWVETQLDGSQARLSAKIADLRAVADVTVAAVSRIATELRPIMLDELELAAAMEWLVEKMADQSGLRISLDVRYRRDPKDAAIRTTLFRVLQESLTNAARHANATRIDVCLEQNKGQFVLTVQDDGQGHRPARHRVPNSNLGILGMQERAVSVGGTLEILSEPGCGMKVVLRVPARRTAAGQLVGAGP